MDKVNDVPAAAPLAADRTKCRWYCGMTMNAIYEDDRQVILGEKFHAYDPRTNADQRWCSAACRDARLPPLAAQSAETAHDECCEPGCSTSCPARKPAPQPAPACAHGCSDTQANTACPTHGKPAPAKPMQLPPQRTDCADCGGPHAAAACPGRPAVPSCMRPGLGYVECDGIVNGGLCESHAMLSRMSVGKPARVEGLRRLGHIAGMHDDDLIGGAR